MTVILSALGYSSMEVVELHDLGKLVSNHAKIKTIGGS